MLSVTTTVPDVVQPELLLPVAYGSNARATLNHMHCCGTFFFIKSDQHLPELG